MTTLRQPANYALICSNLGFSVVWSVRRVTERRKPPPSHAFFYKRSSFSDCGCNVCLLFQMSISTVSTGTRHYRRSASSILSCDSDIRFTRKKLSSQYRCGCCLIAIFLTLMLVAAASVYVGCKRLRYLVFSVWVDGTEIDWDTNCCGGGTTARRLRCASTRQGRTGPTGR